jgi:hypothetical protein
MVESGSSLEEWENFKDLLRHAGEQISQIAQFVREGRGSREEIANLLDEMSDLVGTTLPNSLTISWGPSDDTWR